MTAVYALAVVAFILGLAGVIAAWDHLWSEQERAWREKKPPARR